MSDWNFLVSRIDKSDFPELRMSSVQHIPKEQTDFSKWHEYRQGSHGGGRGKKPHSTVTFRKCGSTDGYDFEYKATFCAKCAGFRSKTCTLYDDTRFTAYVKDFMDPGW